MRNPILLRNHAKIKKFICILLILALILPLGISAPVYAGAGTSWTHVGIDINDPLTDPATAPTELSISNGTPYVAYLEPAAPDGSAEAKSGEGSTGESTAGKVVVKKLVEDTWVTLDGIAPGEEDPDGFVTGDIVIDFSLSVSNDTPYIAFTTTNGSGYLITIMKYAEDGGWEKVTDIEANRLIGMDLSVANDIPYLAFADMEDIYIIKCNDEEIAFVGRSLPIPQAQSLSLQCDENGMLYVSYNNSGFIEVLERSSSPDDVAEWDLVGGEALSEVGSDPSLFVNNQTLFVAYKEGKTCFVKSFSGSHWEQLGDQVEDSSIENISIYVDSSGKNDTPYLAYEGASNYATALKYDSSSDQWIPVTGTNSHASTFITSGLSLAANNGIPYVSYIQSNQVMVMNYVELPSFSAHPQDQTVTPGQDVTFSVTAAGPAPLSYQWLKNGTEISGANAQTLTITNVKTKDAGDYTCRVTNGSGSKVSNTAALKVTSKDGDWQIVGNGSISPSGVKFTSLSVYEGIPFVAFTDYWGGYTAAVKRFVNNQWESVGNAYLGDRVKTGSLYVTEGTPYLAYLTETNELHVIKYNTESSQATWETLGIITGLTNADQVSLYVYNNIPYVVYNDTLGRLAVKKFEAGSTSAVSVGSLDDWQSDTNTFAMLKGDDKGNLYLSFQMMHYEYPIITVLKKEIQGGNWNQLGNNVTLGNASNPSLAIYNGVPYVAYTDMQQSGPGAINYGQLVKFQNGSWVPASEANTLNETMKIKSLVIDGGVPYVAYCDENEKPSVVKLHEESWAKLGSSGYAAPNKGYALSLAVNNAIPYISYSEGINSNIKVAKYLPVSLPIISTEPADKSVLEGESAAFSVSTSGNTSLTYQWHKDGEDILGATSSYYSISSAVSSDAGRYSCSITNAGGTVKTREALLTVKEAGTLGLTAKAGNKQVKLTWDSFPGATRYKVYLNNSLYSDVDGNSYYVRYLVNGTPYQFEVRALSDGTTFIGSSAKITATPLGVPGVPTNVTAASGDGQATVTFQEPADHGDSPITGYTVTSSPGGITANSTGTSITVTGLTNDTSYIFTVKAINGLGEGDDSVPSNAVTPAYEPPVEAPSITTQPQDKTVLEGSSAFFSVSTSGNTSLTYQWHKDGEDILGATSSYYSISSAVSSDAGRYSCSITNAGGTVKTREALLTVKEAGTLGLTAKAGNKQVKLTWNSFPNATRYKVYLNNSLYSDVDGNSYYVRYLVNGTPYQFEVRALSDGTTFIGSSAKITATPLGVPGVPTNVTVASGDGQATVTFQEPADHGDSPITGYTVTSSPGGITANSTGTSITITGLTNDTSYTFTVKAINGLGEGDDSVPSNAVTPSAPGSQPGGGSGGGNGGSSPSKTPAQTENGTIIVNGVSKAAGTSQITTDTDGKRTTTVTVDSEKLKELLSSEKVGVTVTIPVKNGSAAAKGILTGEMVKNMENKEAVLVIQTDRASYTLPASQINIDKVSEQLGKDVSLSEIAVTITVSEPAGTMSKVIENAAKQGGFSVVAPSVDFTISGTYKGSTVNVSSFNTYVDRLVAIPAGIDPEKITTGVVVTSKGTTYHVPTQVVVINGVYYAKINSLTNSTYSVIWNPIEFDDVAKHWSKSSVNNMGSRMVVNGVGGGNYDPNRSITRAEFAAIIVRALGLAPGSGTNSFSDVASSAWYSGYIETASSYGIIKGYDNGKFGPQDTISREQAMAMLARAMKITGLETALTTEDVNQLTAAYTDGASISAYAKQASAACLKSGIVAGRSNSTIAPESSVTRAEVAAMMERLLQKSDLI